MPNKGSLSAVETYLGDGLYASFDGFMFTLRTPREDGDHFVCLDPSVVHTFADYVEQIMHAPGHEKGDPS